MSSRHRLQDQDDRCGWKEVEDADLGYCRTRTFQNDHTNLL